MELMKTPLNPVHRELKARLIDFSGWEMPVWYTSILEEHKAVRTACGIFDVSDMGRVWVTGKNAGAFLDKMFTKPAGRLPAGGAQLCLMLQEDGGIIDDMWVYVLGPERYLIVWNAANIPHKLAWIERWAGNDKDVRIDDVSARTTMVAVQGPQVKDLKSLRGVVHLPRFGHMETELGGISVFISRTGYTGEDGFEVFTDNSRGRELWELFVSAGVKPCGLGSRDLLRLEAGMMLSGQDFNATTNPLEAGLSWLVDFAGSDFIGKKALLAAREKGITRRLVGFKMDAKEIARSGYPIAKDGKAVGQVTSGGFSPSVGANIGFGYVPIELAKLGTQFDIMIRNKPVPAHVVEKKFYGGRPRPINT